MATRITFICTNCGEDFSESVQEILDMPQDEIMAPSLCRDCGCNADD